jgi:site-specific recombinase XerD
LKFFCQKLLTRAGTRVPARIKKAAEFPALCICFVGQDYSPLQGLVFLPGSKKPRISEAFVIPAGCLKTFIEDEYSAVTSIEKDWLKITVDKFNNPDKYIEKKQDLRSFIADFVSRSEKRINPNTGRPVCYRVRKNYERVQGLLFDFKPDLDFNDIDIDFYHDWIEFLQDHDKKFSTNTIGGFIKILKIFMNDATDKGINSNMAFKKGFTVLEEEAEDIYLTIDEIEKIENLDLTEMPGKDKVRDLFLIGCWTGLRLSDYKTIISKDIQDGFIVKKQQKTEQPVVLPIHPTVKRIFEKYDNKLPEPISDQKFNDALKVIAKKAKIKDKVHISITKGGIKKSKAYEKWQHVSSHTARRSFATNLYKQGFPALSIAKLTGHKTEQAFLKYIKVTPTENARMLAEHWSKSNLKVV